MFQKGQIVLVTGDVEENNTRGKLGKIVKIWGSDYKIGFFEKLDMSNGDTEHFIKEYGPIKSTWWVKERLLKSAISKNKFK